ncbi:MAG: hypothetical protein U1F67_13820 [Rubrivivax sp.]
MLAQAERTLGNAAAAQAAVDKALAAAPAHVPALALRVKLMADRGDIAAALAQLRAYTVMHPAAGELWQPTGELLGGTTRGWPRRRRRCARPSRPSPAAARRTRRS